MIHFRQTVVRPGARFDERVQLCVDCLRIAMLGALDEKGHHPCREYRHTMPTERVPVEYRPEDRIRSDDQERGRMRCPSAYACESLPHDIAHHVSASFCCRQMYALPYNAFDPPQYPRSAGLSEACHAVQCGASIECDNNPIPRRQPLCHGLAVAYSSCGSRLGPSRKQGRT